MNKLLLILALFFASAQINATDAGDSKASLEVKFEESKKSGSSKFTCSGLLDVIVDNDQAQVAAILKENPELVNCEHASTTNSLSSQLTKRPLTLAVRLGHTAIVQQLLNAGAQINYMERSGTALHHAVDNRTLDIVKILLDHNAHIYLPVYDLGTVLQYAKEQKDFADQYPGLLPTANLDEIIQLLEEHHKKSTITDSQIEEL